jgi:hypothetical protein
MARAIRAWSSRRAPPSREGGIICVRDPNLRLVAGLIGQPLKEPLEVCQCRVLGCLAQVSVRALAGLIGKTLLEGARLLVAKCFEITMLGINLKAVKRLGDGINRLLTVTFGLTQVLEVSVLDSFVVCAVFRHRFRSSLEVMVYGGLATLAYA